MVNASGDPEKYSYLLGGRGFEYFSVGPAALADGVHYFILSPTDAAERTGNMSPALASWITGHGTRVADFPSQVYKTVQLWYVPASPYDPVADVVDISGGVYVNTVGSRLRRVHRDERARGLVLLGLSGARRQGHCSAIR